MFDGIYARRYYEKNTFIIVKNFNKLSLSNLILIILDDRNYSDIRDFAKAELRKRTRNLGIPLEELIHFDDMAIAKRGYDIDNYLISNNVNMQKLMEIWSKPREECPLLFSEKHLCSDMDLGTGFFTKLSKIEIKNLSRRLLELSDEHQKEVMLHAKKLLEERNKRFEEEKMLTKKNFDELLGCNDAMLQLDNKFSPLEPLGNISDDEMYKLISSGLGNFKLLVCDLMSDSILDTDIVQSLYGLKFIRKDSSKLKKQKRQLLQEAKNGSTVDYEKAGVMKLELKK